MKRLSRWFLGLGFLSALGGVVRGGGGLHVASSALPARRSSPPMLTMEEAKKIALAELNKRDRPEGEIVVLDEYTLAKPYGWVFLYNTRKYMETDNFLFALGGNGPLIVEHNKRLHWLGSNQLWEDAVAALEKKRGWRG